MDLKNIKMEIVSNLMQMVVHFRKPLNPKLSLNGSILGPHQDLPLPLEVIARGGCHGHHQVLRLLSDIHQVFEDFKGKVIKQML